MEVSARRLRELELERAEREMRKTPPYWFEEVAESELDPGLAAAAEDMRRFVVQDLALPRLRVRWFRLTDDPVVSDGQGRYVFLSAALLNGVKRYKDPGVIWVCADLTAVQVPSTVAHEARHERQWWLGGEHQDDKEKARREHDAVRYAELAVTAYQMRHALSQWPPGQETQRGGSRLLRRRQGDYRPGRPSQGRGPAQ